MRSFETSNGLPSVAHNITRPTQRSRKVIILHHAIVKHEPSIAVIHMHAWFSGETWGLKMVIRHGLQVEFIAPCKHKRAAFPTKISFRKAIFVHGFDVFLSLGYLYAHIGIHSVAGGGLVEAAVVAVADGLKQW